jgi:hypothetical protein
MIREGIGLAVPGTWYLQQLRDACVGEGRPRLQAAAQHGQRAADVAADEGRGVGAVFELLFAELQRVPVTQFLGSRRQAAGGRRQAAMTGGDGRRQAAMADGGVSSWRRRWTGRRNGGPEIVQS